MCDQWHKAYVATFPDQATISAAEFMARCTGEDSHGGPRWQGAGPSLDTVLSEDDREAEAARDEQETLGWG